MTENPELLASRSLLGEIAEEFLVLSGVDWGRMLSSPGLRLRGKVFAVVVSSGGLMLKLPGQRADALVNEGLVEYVVMSGRSMREWVVVPFAAGYDAWHGLVGEAHRYLDEITPPK